MSATVEWTLLYHGGGGTQFKGRAEFLRMMFEDKGVAYEATDENLYGPKGIMDCFRGSAEAILATDDISNPIFFPPAIRHRPADGEEVSINQVAACMMYIGDILGYAPTSPKEKAIADAIILNAMDYIARGRSSFHPVKDAMSYKDQKEEGDKASLEWSKEKMPIWLAHFEKVVKKHGPKAPIAGGKSVTYADFALFHVLDATISQFNNEKYDMAWDKQKVPNLKEYYEWFGSRPNLKAYRESGRMPRKSRTVVPFL